MKNLFKCLLVVVSLALVTSCAGGPSAEELAKIQSDSIAKADSITLVEKAKADSLVIAANADSCKAAEAKAAPVKK